jgi:hypothetical protein
MLLMMGLSDKSYLLSWFVFSAAQTILCSIILVVSLKIDIFQRSSLTLLFSMCIAYGSGIYGVSVSLAALFSNKKGSGMGASIFHLTSFFLNNYIYVESWAGKLLVSSFLPNYALNLMLSNLMHCELDGGVGLTFQTSILKHQNFSFLNALGS